MKKFSQLLVIVSFVFSGFIMAASLSPAKSAGLIGEQSNGYLGLVKSASSEIKMLVKEVNNKRKARYKKIAVSKKISLGDVEKIAGRKAIEKTKSGNYIKRAGQGWSKKK